jgi:polyisoprenoid-binding protein YceI
MTARRCSRLIILLLALALPAAAQVRAIDPARSAVTIHVGKSGVFSAFGHEHEVRGPIAQGSVQASGADPRVEVVVRAADLKVLDPGVKDSDRSEIQSTMLGPKVLDASRFPEIRFRSTRIQREGDAWKIEGELTLRGQTHPVMVIAREAGGHYTANTAFKQTAFAITPVNAGGGTVKVKDEVKLEFDIVLK